MEVVAPSVIVTADASTSMVAAPVVVKSPLAPCERVPDAAVTEIWPLPASTAALIEILELLALRSTLPAPPDMIPEPASPPLTVIPAEVTIIAPVVLVLRSSWAPASALVPVPT